MKAKKKYIIAQLKAKGFHIDYDDESMLLIAYDVYLELLVEEETTLLLELLRIENKRSKNEELTYLESVFYKFVRSKYKKD